MCDLIELYALDALAPEEIEQFEHHLKTCGECQALLPELQAVALELALSVPEVKPPARLKMKVMAIPLQEKRAHEFTSASAAVEEPPVVADVVKLPLKSKIFIACGTIAASFLIGTTLANSSYLVNDNTPSQPSIAAPANALEQISSASDSSVINKKVPGGGRVSLAYSHDLDKAVFSASELKELPKDQHYQLWFKNLEGELLPAGYFTHGSDSLVLMDGHVQDAVAVGVTVETEANPSVPTSNPLMFMTI